MNFFESELHKIVQPGVPFTDPTYSGSACFGTLGENLRVKLQFVTCGTSEHYEAIKATIINRNEGPVDSVVIKLGDVMGNNQMRHPTSGTELSPHIWKYNDKLEWYGYKPSPPDYFALTEAVSDYCSVFRSQEMGDQGMKMNQQL